MGNTRRKLWRMSLPMLICLLIGGGFFTFPAAQPAAAATDGYAISGGAGPNHRPSVAISPDNSKVCATWTTFNNNPNRAYVRIYSTTLGSWSPDLTQPAYNVAGNSDGSAQGNTARCAIDGAGRTHVVWVEYPDGAVRYSMLPPGADPANGANWTNPVTITSASDDGDGQNPDIVSIFADANGNVWVTYWSLNNNGVYVRQWVNGSGWSGATRVSSSGGKHPRIGADNQGFVHVVYQQSGAGMRYSYYDPNTRSWSIDNAVPGAGGLIEQSGIAVDRDNGDVHIVYTVQLGGDDNTRVVRYIRKTGRTGTKFVGQQDLTGQGNHVVARIAWSPAGKLTMVADKRNDRAVTIATSDNNGVSWSGASNLTSGNASQAWPSVAMDAAGNSYITYWTGENINFIQLGNAANPGGGPAITSGPTDQATECGVGRVIRWDTQFASSSSVEYGPTVGYGSSAGGAAGTSHTVILGNLSPNALYHYRVLSTTASGTAVSGDRTFVATDPGFTCWSSQGGVLADAPAAAAFNGRLYAFAVGVDPADPNIHPLYVKSSADGANWTGWQSLGGNLTAAPAAAAFNGRLYVFAAGTDPQNPAVRPLYVKSSADGTAFGDWASLGGNLTDAPAATAFNGRLYALAKGIDPTSPGVYPLYLKSSADGSTFGDWSNLGGNLTAAPAAAAFGGRLHLFAAGTAGGMRPLYTKSSADGSNFTDWANLGGDLTSAPAAAVYFPAQQATLAVLARGSDGALYLRTTLDGAAYADWRSLGGFLKGAPAAAGLGDRLYVLARGSDDALYERHSLP